MNRTVNVSTSKGTTTIKETDTPVKYVINVCKNYVQRWYG